MGEREWGREGGATEKGEEEEKDMAGEGETEGGKQERRRGDER